MRIAIATTLAALDPGGLEVLVRELALGLSRDHQVILATTDTPEAIASSPLADCIEDFISTPNDGASIPWNISFANDLRQRNVDICHFHLTGTYGWNSGSLRLSPIPYAHAAGIRCFTTNHQAVSPFDINRTDQTLPRRLLSFAVTWPGKNRCIDAVESEILVSQNDLELMRRCFPLHKEKLRLIYHSRLDSHQNASPVPESRIILNLATICFRKGQHILAEAFSRIAGDFPDWKLKLVGQIAEKECVDAIRNITRTHGLENRIQLSGPTSQPMLEMENAELYVQPSLLEGLGLSLQEAMFIGRPCIGSRIGGIPELIDHEKSGLLVRPDDPHDLAAALSRLMSDRPQREKFAIAARAAIPAKGMTRDAMLEAYQNLYQSPLS